MARPVSPQHQRGQRSGWPTGRGRWSGYLDAADAAESDSGSPQDEVEAFFSARGGHVPELEPGPEGAQTGKKVKPSRLVKDATELVSASARAQALGALQRYRRDAAEAMPMPNVMQEIAQIGPDPLALAASFGLSTWGPPCAVSPACPRSRPGLVICDGSGTITFRKAGRWLRAAALWRGLSALAAFRALSRPMVPLYEPLHQPGRAGDQTRRRGFAAYAVAQPRSAPGLNREPLYEAYGC